MTKRTNNTYRPVRRDQIQVGGYVQSGNMLLAVDEVEVIETNRLRVTTHVVSRTLCAETLVHGETHPTIVVMI